MFMRSEIRKDYIEDAYVIIAPQRARRPVVERPECLGPLPGPKTCVFCAGNIKPAEVIERDGEIVVLQNAYPAVSLDNPKARGVQEVVVETADHTRQLEELSVLRIKKLLDMYAERTHALSNNATLEYILIFKNAGGRAGASLRHAHSQVFATELVPPHLADKARRAREYRKHTGHCVYCDVIKKERKSPRRIYEDTHVIAFAPYASQHNYEVWILPKRHIDNITELTPAARLAWAKILKRILKKIVALKLPYNYYFHQLINDPDQHLYMKITPRGSVWAGVEIGSGIIINPVAPEDAASYFRK